MQPTGGQEKGWGEAEGGGCRAHMCVEQALSSATAPGLCGMTPRGAALFIQGDAIYPSASWDPGSFVTDIRLEGATL